MKAWSILLGAALPIFVLLVMAGNPHWSNESSTKVLVVGASLFVATSFVVIRQKHPALIGFIETALATWSLWLVIGDASISQFGLRLTALVGATYVMTRGLSSLYLHVKEANDADTEVTLVTLNVACPSCGARPGDKCEPVAKGEFKVARFERAGVHNRRLYAFRMQDAVARAATKSDDR